MKVRAIALERRVLLANADAASVRVLLVAAQKATHRRLSTRTRRAVIEQQRIERHVGDQVVRKRAVAAVVKAGTNFVASLRAVVVRLASQHQRHLAHTKRRVVHCIVTIAIALVDIIVRTKLPVKRRDAIAHSGLDP